MPTDEKQLMIRGDRLLLAFDVLLFLESRYFGWWDHKFRHDFRLGAVRKVIRDVCPHLTDANASIYYGRFFSELNQLLGSATGLENLELDLETLWEVYVPREERRNAIFSGEKKDLKKLRKLFEMIASGKLTEADFR